MDDKKIMYTFYITYDGIDDFGSIQFCAESKSEAHALFREWCITDNKMKTPIEPNCITVVYNEQDAEEYGSYYGVKRDGRIIYNG